MYSGTSIFHGTEESDNFAEVTETVRGHIESIKNALTKIKHSPLAISLVTEDILMLLLSWYGSWLWQSSNVVEYNSFSSFVYTTIILTYFGIKEENQLPTSDQFTCSVSYSWMWIIWLLHFHTLYSRVIDFVDIWIRHVYVILYSRN